MYVMSCYLLAAGVLVEAPKLKPPGVGAAGLAAPPNENPLGLILDASIVSPLLSVLPIAPEDPNWNPVPELPNVGAAVGAAGFGVPPKLNVGAWLAV